MGLIHCCWTLDTYLVIKNQWNWIFIYIKALLCMIILCHARDYNKLLLILTFFFIPGGCGVVRHKILFAWSKWMKDKRPGDSKIAAFVVKLCDWKFAKRRHIWRIDVFIRWLLLPWADFHERHVKRDSNLHLLCHLASQATGKYQSHGDSRSTKSGKLFIYTHQFHDLRHVIRAHIQINLKLDGSRRNLSNDD